MVDIKINEDYKITSDNRQFILKKKTVVKGEVKWSSIHYYASLESMLHNYALYKGKCSESESIIELLGEMLKATEEAKQAYINFSVECVKVVMGKDAEIANLKGSISNLNNKLKESK